MSRRVLHVIATPRPAGISRTRRIAEAFLETYTRMHPEDTIDELDLETAVLPDIDTATIDALFGQRNGSDPREVEARRRSLDAVVAPLLACDKLLVTSPMWNFTVPYRLKHWLDLVIQPGRTFRVHDGRAEGVLSGRPALVLLSRSFFYGRGTAGAAKNHFEPYLETALGFIGFREIRFVALDGAELPGADARLAQAMVIAGEIAREF